METVNIQIKRHLVVFKKAEHKIEAVFNLKEILFLLNEKEDSKTQYFLNQIQKELCFKLGETNWKKIEIPINCPEIGVYTETVNKCLFAKEQLREKFVYAPDNSLISTWDYVNKLIDSWFVKYTQLYLQTVA